MKARGFGRVYKRTYSAGRPPVWWIEYWFRGVMHRESSHSAKEAVAVRLLKRRHAEMGTGQLVGPRVERITIDDLLRAVENDYKLKNRKSPPPVRQLRAHFPSHARALDVTPERVTKYMLDRRAEGAAAQTVKLEVAVLGRGFKLMRLAKPDWEMPSVNNARTGFFTDSEVARLLPCLPDYLQPVVETAYITGWRRGELRGLQWAQVDWESGVMRLERGTTKSGDPRQFPFAAHPRLLAILRAQLERTRDCERVTGHLVPWVFHRAGRQVRGWYYDAWASATRKAGMPGRLFHDFRRSAVRNLVRAGVSEQVAMTLSGHKTRSVFDRYNITSSADQVEAVRKLAAMQGATAPGARKVVAIGDALSETTHTEPARFGHLRRRVRAQDVAAHRASLASPTGFEPVLPP